MTGTSDRDYADLLARLQAIPAQQPERKTFTAAQERGHLFDDLLDVAGEAPW